MQGRRISVAGAQPEEGAGEFFKVGGEVFRAHGWELWLCDMFFSQVGFSHFLQEINLFRCIDGGAVASDIVQLRMGVEHDVQAFQDFPQSCFHLVPKLWTVGTAGAFQISILNPYVVTGARIHEADGAHHIVHGVHFPGNQGLYINDEMSCCHQGVGAVMRLGSMGGFPFDMDIETIRCRHEGTGL